MSTPVKLSVLFDRYEGDKAVFKIVDADVELHVPAYLLPDKIEGMWMLAEDPEATEREKQLSGELLDKLTNV